MFNINELSMSNNKLDFNESNGSIPNYHYLTQQLNNNHNHRNGRMYKLNNLSSQSASNNTRSLQQNRQLFKSCKSIIQQQMLQISSLQQQNQTLKSQLQQKQHKQKQAITTENHLSKQLQQMKNKNQHLHQQLNNSLKTIYELKCGEKQMQSNLNSLESKCQLLLTKKEEIIKEMQQQLNEYKEKCLIFKENNIKIINQNQYLKKIIENKDYQMAMELKSLKNVSQMIKRKGCFDQEGDRKNYYCQIKPFNTVNEEPFKSIQLIKCRNQNTSQNNKTPNLGTLKYSQSTDIKSHLKQQKQNNRVVAPFSIIDRKLQTSPMSRIRKNYLVKPASNSSKQENKYRNNISTNIKRHSPTSSILTSNNPQLQMQLSDIKKQIRQQYGKMEIKKQKMNHERISNTLHEIENKLKRMTKIVGVDDSQSQMDNI